MRVTKQTTDTKKAPSRRPGIADVRLAGLAPLHANHTE
jgi:hypothetical protein